ncbi:MAG: hypothetical protein IID37_12770 [Planctomycetes bacterium]|nr:hypothetical protein [Planctomycetota bacterium]
MRGVVIGLWLTGSVVGTAGAISCVADARVDLAATQSLNLLAHQMELTLAEYHAETESSDDLREGQAIAAFVVRVRKELDDEAALNRSIDDFTEAFKLLRGDRRTEWLRYMDAMENVGLIGEVADGLRELAIDSMSLEDDVRRYLTGLLEAAQQADIDASTSPPPPGSGN